MKTFAVLVLDTRRPKADVTYAVLLRIIHYGKVSPISTGIYIKAKDWDAKQRIIKLSYRGRKSVTRLNNRLLKKKTELTNLITKLDEQNKLDSLRVLEIKKLIEHCPQDQSFFAYNETLIQELKDAQRLGNARAYESTPACSKR